MNKLTNCKACGKEISKSAKKCPDCGHDSRNFFVKHKIITGLLVVIVFVMIANSGSKTPTTTATTDTSKPATTASAPADTTPAPTPTPAPAKPTVPTEYISALASAETYANTMNMSKDAIYDQLTASAGNQFSPKSAQYAVDNVKADWNANALKSAETYQKDMHMSPNAIYDQLISSAGNKFTPSQAKYAKDNLK